MQLNDLEKESLIQDYLNGVTWNNLCKKYNTDLYTIHKILKKANVTKNRIEKSSWSLEKQELFKNMYLSNATYNEMYEALNCKGGTLTYWVHKLNLPMRGSGRNNVYPNKFLEHTPESDYWLGYIFADGHIGVYLHDKGQNHYIVELASEKKYVVDKYKEWYNNLPNIYERPYILQNGTVKTMYKAVMHCKDLALWFKEVLYIDNVKHHTLNPPININWDIIRGFFEGDGCSSKGEFTLYSCSVIWLERIKEFIESFDIKDLILKPSYLDCYKLALYNKEELFKLVPLLYSNRYYCHEYKFKNLEPYLSNEIVQTE